MKSFCTNTGFTLVELIVTVSIASILVSFGVPGVSTLVQNNRTSTNVGDFLSALNFTRSEAIKRGSRVTMCIANVDFNQCSSNRKWQNGWLIFNDPTGNTITVADPADILQVFQSLGGSQTSLDLPGSTRDKTHVSFSSRGTAFDQLSGDGSTPFDKLTGSNDWTFVLCDDRLLSENKRFARKIILSSRGRARSLVANDTSGPVVTSCI